MFVIRDAQDSDLPGIAQLYFDIEHPADRDVEKFSRMWRWLFRESASSARAFVGVDDDNRVIGHYGMIPFEFVREGVRFGTGGFLCRLMVAEAYRKHVLFPHLELKMLGGYRAAGVDFAYGLITRPAVLKAHL